MRNRPFILALLYSFFFLTGSVFGIGEKIISFGAASSWNLMEKRQGVIEASLIRPNPVLVLASGQGPETLGRNSSDTENCFAGFTEFADESSLDLRLSFDERRPGDFSDTQGHYDLSVSPELAVAAAPWSRLGAGAAMFSGKTGDEPIVLKPRSSALLASGSRPRDFSIEFWLYPMNVENGGQILSLTSSKPDGQGTYIYQRVQCIVLKNRLQWTFGDFFFLPGEKERKSLDLSGPPVLPRTWSHHLIRFDADLGLLEYLVDGKVEALDYVTSTGREGGEVYTPVIGENCQLTLGSRFSGMMDEFRIYRSCLEKAVLAKYPSEGGRVESRTLDLGNADSRIIKIEAFGGRTGGPGTYAAGRVQNEYTGDGTLRFSDYSELRFFIRISNSPYLWNDVPWIPFDPGTALPDSIRGRYIQVAADFYPGEDGETSPYLAELRLIYNAAEPPPPPTRVSAVAKNGAVELSWNESPSRSVGGYLVYYGTAKGEYFGDRGILAGTVQVVPPASPIDAGNLTSVRIEGLNNGTLYYFAVAAYNRPEIPNTGERAPEPGDFSREVAARPLRMAE